MRERGAKITDFIILVIAAEDGLMPQTIESINFALKYNVPLIVALNKIDKLDNLKEKDVEAIIKKIENNLLENKVELESLGGDVQLIKISALEKIGLDDLKEAILAQAELLNLKSTLNKGVRGTIIESSLDKQKGKLTTILVENGTLKKGDVIVTENQLAYAKVRAIFDENTQLVDKIRPGLSIRCFQCSSDEDKAKDNCGSYERFDTNKNTEVDCTGEDAVTPGPRGFIWDGRWRTVTRRCAQVSERETNLMESGKNNFIAKFNLKFRFFET
ncbi:hypothetical protein RND71_043634 [Anisodus tanguticus]|uniref:Tr-type G domain-containing protein n=1 Tax=Anisodus tanguticus TaxID=243964 RepID=A0AAE1QNM4_9SOLA|nr:hypothetical protein RND71_043634 [Anisodus tanguticus]